MPGGGVTGKRVIRRNVDPDGIVEITVGTSFHPAEHTRAAGRRIWGGDRHLRAPVARVSKVCSDRGGDTAVILTTAVIPKVPR